MDVLSIIGSIIAVLFVFLIIAGFWTILWKFFLYKFPFIQAIVSGDKNTSKEPEGPVDITEQQAQREREERIRKKRTRKAE